MADAANFEVPYWKILRSPYEVLACHQVCEYLVKQKKHILIEIKWNTE